MTRKEAYVSIVRAALSDLPPGGDSVLACMLALHANDIILADSCNPTDLTSAVERRELFAVTRRHAAEIVAAATGNATDQYTIDYWYAKYCSATPYEVMEDIPPPLLNRVLEAVTAMRKASIIKDIVEAE